MNCKINIIRILDKLCMFFFFLYMVSYNIFSYRYETVIISEIILIILLVSISIYILHKRKIRIGILGLLYSLYFAWSCCTVYWAINQQVAFQRLKTLGQLIILSMILYNYFDSKEKIAKAIKMITFSFVILCIYSINKYGLSNLLNGSIGGRIGNDISQINVLGISLALGSILCFYYGLYKNKKLYYLGTLMLFIVSSFTGSRKALIIALLGISILTFMKNRMKKYIKTIILSSIIIVIMYYILTLPMFELVLERLNGFFNSNGSLDASSITRINMIKVGWMFFVNNPIIGYGLDCFRFLAYGTYSHNNYIEMLINGGIIEFILFYSLYIYSIFKLSIKAYKFDEIAILLLIILIIQLVMDFAQVSYYSKIIYIYFAICFSYISVDKKIS